MANCALEEYVLFLQELMNGPGGPVGIRDSAGGQNTNEDKDAFSVLAPESRGALPRSRMLNYR